jgi:Fe2+ transport system protein FeoA
VSRSAEGSVRCGLCGHVFDPNGLACHEGCPLGARCRLICCPNCGYEVPDESRIPSIRLLGRLRRRRARPVSHDVEALPLSTLRDGAEAIVRSLDGMPGPRSARLSAFGLVPGVAVTLLQRRPVPVVRVGMTEIALGEEILEQILVSGEREGSGGRQPSEPNGFRAANR